MSIYFIIAASMLTIIILIRVFRVRIIRWLLKVRAQLKLRSLGKAIQAADDEKARTRRKAMVVYNSHSGEFEPITKRLLKAAERAGKSKGSAAKTKYRKRHQPAQKKKYLTETVTNIEKKAPYVTN